MEFKRAQVKMSFGMIFSIILIIIFLIFAFYAIRTFLNIGSGAQTGQFVNDLQGDINRIWTGETGSEQREYTLPSRIKYVCFVDFSVSAKGANSEFYNDLRKGFESTENMVFYPFVSSGIGSAEIRNINLGTITSQENPYCIQNSRGVRMTLSKDFGESLVRISR